MADNFQVTQGSGTVIAADQAVGGEYYQKVKLVDPTADSTTGIGISSNPMRVDPTGTTTQPIVGTQTSASGTLNALNAAVTLAIGGYKGASWVISAGTFVGTILAEQSFDNGTNWTNAWIDAPSTGVVSAGVAFGSSNTLQQNSLKVDLGATHVRMRVSVFTSGTANSTIFASYVDEPSIYTYAKDPAGVIRPILCDTLGNLSTSDIPISLIVSTTAATGVIVTNTLPASAGNFHYISAIEITKYFTAANAASATPLVVTTTNLSGSLAFSFGQPLGTIGTSETRIVTLANPLKSSVVNTATTIVCPATTGIIWRVNTFYYTAP